MFDDGVLWTNACQEEEEEIQAPHRLQLQSYRAALTTDSWFYHLKRRHDHDIIGRLSLYLTMTALLV